MNDTDDTRDDDDPSFPQPRRPDRHGGMADDYVQQMLRQAFGFAIGDPNADDVRPPLRPDE